MFVYKHKGFTVIEMMVVIMMMGVVLAILVPKFGQMRADNRTNALANELGSALRSARTTSLLRHRRLTFSSLDASDSTNLWGKQGWQFADAATTEIMFRRRDIPTAVTINSPAGVSTFVFDGLSGRVTQADTTPIDVAFVVCDAQVRTELGYTVALGRFGSVAVTKNTALTTCNP